MQNINNKIKILKNDKTLSQPMLTLKINIQNEPIL